jgi:hypothetical protein
MVKKLHKLEGSEHFLRLYASFQRRTKRSLEVLATGTGDTQRIYDALCTDSLVLACITLILDRSDDEIRQHFNDGTRYAIEWLRAPGSTQRMRTYDVEIGSSEHSSDVLAIHERKPDHRPRPLSITDYGRILGAVVAFGTTSQMQEVAEFPEQGYQSPEDIVEPYFFEYLRAWREWLRGDLKAATARIARVITIANKPQPNATLLTLAAMAAADSEGFRKHLDELLTAYKAQVQRAPNDPEGVVSMVGLGLCRLARDRGITVADGPYVPVRLLPNYGPTVS